MRKRRVIYSLLAVCFIFLIGAFLYFRSQQRSTTEKFDLVVRVVHMYDKTPVTDVWVDAVSSRGLVVDEQSSDRNGLASFYLPAGKYSIRIAAGYTGYIDLDLQSNRSIELGVLPVSR